MRIYRTALLGLLAATAPGLAAANDWEHTFVLYGIGATIDGRAGVGPVEGDVDISFSDILDNLEFAAMTGYRGDNGRFGVMADLIYMDLKNDKTNQTPLGAFNSTVDLDQLILELDGSIAVTERLDAYAGLRYWDVDSEVTVTGPLGNTLNAGRGEDWVDVLYGLRYALPLGRNWTFIVRGDVSPFGTGSDFGWHTSAFADWRFGEHASLLVGFRWLDIDYDDGEGAERFLMDVGQGGPALGIAWSF